MARKISQLPLSGGLLGADKLMITEDSSGESKAITGTELKNFVGSASVETNIIHVAPTGDDTLGGGTNVSPYKTIAHALAEIVAPTINNRFIIQLAPGTYTEDPIVLQDYVGINGTARASVIIQPTDVNSPLISLGILSTLRNMTISGVTNSTGIQNLSEGLASAINVAITNCMVGIEIDNVSAHTLLESIIVLTDISSSTSVKVSNGNSTVNGIMFSETVDLLTGFEVTGADSKIKIYNISIEGGDIGTVMNVSNGAEAYIMSSIIEGNPLSKIGKFISATGVGTEAHSNSVVVSNVDVGIFADDGAFVDAISVDARSCGTAIEIGNTGTDTTVTLVAMSFVDSVDLDVDVQSSSASIIGTANILADDKLNIASGSSFNVSHYSITDGDEGYSIKGELHVGSPDFPSESTLGEGDSYTRGLLAYSYDGSTYTDISESVKSFSGSTFTFPNTSINTAIYLASDILTNGPSSYHKFFGNKMSLETPQVGGSIVAEYWNGSIWAEIKTLTTQSSGDYHRQANLLFTVDAGSYQNVFNPNMLLDWALSNDPSFDANDRYWVRFRIDSTPSTLPVFQQFKLHSNRTEINADGYMEYFGLARPYVSVPVSWNVFNDAGTNVGNQDMWLSSNTPAGFQNNAMEQNESVGTITSLPTWADTSAPLKVLVAFRIDNATNDKQFTLTMNSSNDGTIISTSSPASTVGEIQTTVNPDLSAYSVGQQIWFEFDMDISSYGVQEDGKYPDSIWLNLSYDSGTGVMDGMQFELSMLKFRDGGHI